MVFYYTLVKATSQGFELKFTLSSVNLWNKINFQNRVRTILFGNLTQNGKDIVNHIIYPYFQI